MFLLLFRTESRANMRRFTNCTLAQNELIFDFANSSTAKRLRPFWASVLDVAFFIVAPGRVIFCNENGLISLEIRLASKSTIRSTQGMHLDTLRSARGRRDAQRRIDPARRPGDVRGGTRVRRWMRSFAGTGCWSWEARRRKQCRSGRGCRMISTGCGRHAF